MNVLMITGYVTLKGHSEFMRNQTGFGYMVYDIARAVSKNENVDLLTTDTLGKSFISDQVLFLGRSFGRYLANISRCLSFTVLWKMLREYSDMSKGTKVRLLYYWLLTGYVRSILVRRQYNVVHIHGCGFATEFWVQLCKECHQKYVVTLHGLNSFSDTVKLEPASKRFERAFLRRVTEGEIPITVISTGMKRLIEKTYDVSECNNITVVCNSFVISDSERVGMISVRDKYNIPKDAKVILYVGNISQNKNQTQMVRSFNLLPEIVKEKTWVLFCGNDHAGDSVLSSLIAESKYRRHLILCGGVEKAQMSQYYKASDGVALLSFTEGFGLSLIEGMHFGLPCMMFTDMDAFEDIYNADAVVPIDTRDDRVVASAIETLISNTWNKDRIVSLSKRFDSISMSEKYKRVYELL